MLASTKTIRQIITRHPKLVQAAIWVAAGAWVVLVWMLIRSAERGRSSADLEDSNPAVRAEAVRHLSVRDDQDKLFKMLSDPDPDVRLLAAQGLWEPGPREAERARALLPLLQDENTSVRREAAWALSDRSSISPALIEALDSAQRKRAKELIGRILAPPPPADEPKGSGSPSKE